MRKISLFSVVCLLSLFVVSLTGCKKEEVNNNGNYNNQEYPSTANVIRRAVTDIDGNSYDAVQIGDQVWMAENLRTTRYADGTVIPMGSSYSTTNPYRFAPGPTQSNEENMENMENVPRYGYLYNWPAVMHGASSSEANPSGVQGICPNGWHVPSDAEWTQLTDYMKTQPTYMAGGNADHLAKALSATWGWGSSAEPYAPGYESSAEPDAPGNNPSTNNATGFSVLPAGEYNFDNYYGGFNGGFGYRAYLWSTTETYGYNAYSRYLNYDYADVYRNYSNMDNGFSVRCVRD